MPMLRLIPLGVFAALAAAIVYASLTADIAESFAAIVADPWGLVTLVDLYAAFVLLLVLVALIEPERRVIFLVIVLTPVLGSLVPALWLAARFPMLVRHARGERVLADAESA
jgi:hypothetical protein